MKKALKRITNKIFYYEYGVVKQGAHNLIFGNVSDISGNVTGIKGDVTGISGNVSDIKGDIDDCCITDGESVNVQDLIC